MKKNKQIRLRGRGGGRGKQKGGGDCFIYSVWSGVRCLCFMTCM